MDLQVKHITNIALILGLFISQLIMTIVGIIFIPFFMKRTESFTCSNNTSLPNIRFKDKWFDSIFGNSEDGLLGDIYYKAKTTPSWWTTYNWCAIRNPIHNLALKQGVNETIVSYTWTGNRYTEDRVGREGYVHSVAVGESGKEYHMIRWCKLWYKGYGVECNIGYKNFNIKEVGIHYKYSFTVSVNPFKKFEA